MLRDLHAIRFRQRADIQISNESGMATDPFQITKFVWEIVKTIDIWISVGWWIQLNW